jgi:hypothetical protein
MNPRIWMITTLAALCFLPATFLFSQTGNVKQPKDTTMIPAKEKLVVLWTSGDREVALKMLFMYTYNAKKNHWWEDITLVVWGPSARLLSEDTELQETTKKIIESGVEVRACKGCADQYGVSDKLEELGITVLYIGKEFTDYIKEGRHILTI